MRRRMKSTSTVRVLPEPQNRIPHIYQNLLAGSWHCLAAWSTGSDGAHHSLPSSLAARCDRRYSSGRDKAQLTSDGAVNPRQHENCLPDAGRAVSSSTV
jgi:hypothetical protein